MGHLKEKMIRDMTIRNLTPGTQRKYIGVMTGIAKHYNKYPDTLTYEEIQNYLFFLANERKYAWSTVNIAFASLNFFYNTTLKRDIASPLTLPSRKGQRKLPEIYSLQELEHLFSSMKNRKHRVLLMTAYAGGLRVGELVNLKISDIYSDRKLIKITNGKGQKDRYTILSNRLLEELRVYWKLYHPQSWLFPSPRNLDKPLTTHSALMAFYKAKKEAGLKKGKGIHVLRHCFATHLLEAGVDLRTIQTLLGHGSINTTMMYLQITSKNLTAVKSPFDLLTVSDINKIHR